MSEARSLDFGRGPSLGTVAIRRHGRRSATDWRYLGAATGRRRVPADHEVRLDVSRDGRRRLAALAGLGTHDLDGICFQASDVEDADLVHVRHLVGLRGLDLTDTNSGLSPSRLTGDVAASIAPLVALEGLSLQGVAIDDHGVAQLRSLRRMRWLNLRATAISDASLQTVASLTTLRSLDVSRTTVGDPGITFLGGLPELERLSLTETALTDVGLRSLAAVVPLRWLDVSWTAVGPDGIAALGALQSLRGVDAWETRVTAGDLPRLKSLLPRCDIAI